MTNNKDNRYIKIHNIIFPTDSQALIWKIYYGLRDKIEFKDSGLNKIKKVLKYISENFERLEKEYFELHKTQEIHYEIKKPKKYSEFEVQATLYAILKFNYKIDVRGEVPYKMQSFKELKISSSRFDLVIFKNDKAMCIIEVKNGQRAKANTNTRQHKKYSQFGLKLVYCMNMTFVKNVVEEVLEFHNNFESDSQYLVSSMFDRELTL